MFAWAPIPERFQQLGSVEFAKLLIEKADVAVAPGLGFGEHGEGYVRIALVEKRAAHPAGGAQRAPLPRIRAGQAAQRRSARHAPIVPPT
jgi:alanine-synthesizing transaminase